MSYLLLRMHYIIRKIIVDNILGADLRDSITKIIVKDNLNQLTQRNNLINLNCRTLYITLVDRLITILNELWNDYNNG
jgi:hypothetical protein